MKDRPLRIMDGNAKPYEPFWKVLDSTDSESGEAEISFYGVISEYSWLEDEISPAKFKADLLSAGKGGPVTVRIHSVGGDVFAASAIRAMLVDYPGRVTTRIDGLCASSATFVALAGDVIKMQDSAYLMIHDPWTLPGPSTAEELKSLTKMLEAIKDGIIETYQGRTGLEPEKLSKMMSAETWLTAQEARDLGFVDEVVTTSSKAFELVPNNASVLNCLRSYTHVPLELFTSQNPPPAADIFKAAVEETQEEASEETEIEIEPDIPQGGDDPDDIEAQLLRDYLTLFRRGE
jgi:ATP-dependent protease ClpP protease subunit